MIKKVQVSEVEIESLEIILGVGETHGHSKKEEVKRDFKGIHRMVKNMFDAFTVERAGEGSKPPHGEGSSDGKKDEEKKQIMERW